MGTLWESTAPPSGVDRALLWPLRLAIGLYWLSWDSPLGSVGHSCAPNGALKNPRISRCVMLLCAIGFPIRHLMVSIGFPWVFNSIPLGTLVLPTGPLGPHWRLKSNLWRFQTELRRRPGGSNPIPGDQNPALEAQIQSRGLNSRVHSIEVNF